MYWGVGQFAALYASFSDLQNGVGTVDEPLFEKLIPDLKNMLVMGNDALKNQTSRQKIESGKFTIDDEEYEVNKEFMVTVIQLSDELNCNEMIVAQILLEVMSSENDESVQVAQLSTGAEKESSISETKLVNQAKVAFYLRRQYILQILNFLINTQSPFLLKLTNNNKEYILLENIISSFRNIHQQFKSIQDIVNKYQLLDQYDHFQQMNICFRRDFLKKEYDLMGQILFGMVENGFFFNRNDDITNLVTFVTSELQSNDSFVLYYIPSLLAIPAKMHFYKNDSSVFYHFDKIISDIEKNENLYTQPVKVLYYFTFLTYFISWCNADPEKRIKKNSEDFFESKLKTPMYQLVIAGAIEQLMIISYETSVTSSGICKNSSLVKDEEGYDFKNLLQTHLPKLVPYQLMESNQMVYVGKALKFSSDFLDSFFIPTIHDFIQEFIANCAFLLTTLKDEEEDYLLSGETDHNDGNEHALLLETTAKKADLERFFISVYYVYKNRPALSEVFWNDNQSTGYGFIEWGAKCADTLMRSCFFIMLSGLGSQSSTQVYQYICQNSKNLATWDLLAKVLSEYIVKISKWELQNNGTEVHVNPSALKHNTQAQQNLTPSSLPLSSAHQMHLQLPLQQQLQYQYKGSTLLPTSSFNAMSSPRMHGNYARYPSREPTNQRGSEAENGEAVTVSDDLSEETLIYLSSILSLISATATSLNQVSKHEFSVVFLDVLFEFLKLDTPLVGATLSTISTLVVPENHTHVWLKLDRFIFESNASSSFSSGYKNYFLNKLKTLRDVTGFLKLFETLVAYKDEGFVPFGVLQVPPKLGEGNRAQYGVAPYLEYIIDEVFKNSTSTTIHCLKSFDYQVILDVGASAGTNLDSLVPQKNFTEYVMENPQTFIMSHLFDESVHNILFFIVSVGFDKLISDEETDTETSLCQDSLTILDMILTLQDTFIEETYPIVRQQVRINSKFYVPKLFGLHGQRSFYDAILFNLSFVAHISLYVGLSNTRLASLSLSILDKISSFGASKQIVLNIFDSVDESSRIKQSFIDQVETPIDTPQDFAIKLQLLQYLKSHLTAKNKPTVSHFLLGFQIAPILTTGSSVLSTFISSDVSLLKSLVHLIKQSLSYAGPLTIEYNPIKLVSESFDIIVSLCKNELTSAYTLSFLDALDFFDFVLDKAPNVDGNTLWNGLRFSEISSPGISLATMLEFFKFRYDLLQYFSLEIHRLKFTEQGKSYVESLTSSLILQSSKVFSFLDIIKHYNVQNQNGNLNEIFCTLEIYGTGVSLNQVVSGLERLHIFENTASPTIYDFTSLDSLLNLRKSWLQQSIGGTVNSNQEQVERAAIKKHITQYYSEELFNSLQLSCLHSWVQLVQVLVTDGGLSPQARCSFIMEIFETIIPQINDLVDTNLKYSEELVAMTVFLYDIYDQDRMHTARNFVIDKKLYGLFTTCMHGIVSPLSSIEMRSDLYAIANKFVTKLLQPNEDKKLDAERIALAKDILFEMKMSSEKLVEVIASDAIAGEGPHRLTGLLLLDSLTQLASLGKVNFVISILSRSNMLLLIIRSLKVIDDIVFSQTEANTFDSIYYELTVFKTTMYFLTHIAESKVGAHELIQNELLKILSNSNFAKLDSNLGVELLLNQQFDDNGASHVELKVNLDDSNTHYNNMNTISLFELVVPIFQLVSAILLSTGTENRMVVRNVKLLLAHFEKFIQGILRKDALVEAGDYKVTAENGQNLKELVKLIIILCTLTGYDGIV
ncbi:hypothetical protein ACO0QE_000421 [Hanseniaspora vineae]